MTLNIIHNEVSQSVVMHNNILPSPSFEVNWNELGICTLVIWYKKVTVNAIADFPLCFILQIPFARFSSICFFTKAVSFCFRAQIVMFCFFFFLHVFVMPMSLIQATRVPRQSKHFSTQRSSCIRQHTI